METIITIGSTIAVDLKPIYLFWKVILAIAFPINIGCGTVQTAAEGIGVPERYRDDLKSEFVQLFLLMDFAGFDTNSLGIQYEDIHGKPDARITQRRGIFMGRLGGFNNFPPIDFEKLAVLRPDVAVRIVQKQTRPQRYKRAVNVNRVGIPREIHAMDP